MSTRFFFCFLFFFSSLRALDENFFLFLLALVVFVYPGKLRDNRGILRMNQFFKLTFLPDLKERLESIIFNRRSLVNFSQLRSPTEEIRGGN